MSNKKFTDDDLLRMVDEGLTITEMVARCGVTYAAVRRRACKLNVNPKPAGCYWTDEETEILIKEYHKLSDADRIAKMIGRTTIAVKNKAYSLITQGVINRPAEILHKEYIPKFIRLQPDDIADFERMASEGCTATEIAEYLGVSSNAIRARARKCGIELQCEHDHWNANEEEQLISMFERGNKTSYIAARMGRSKNAITSKAFRLRSEGRLGYHQFAKSTGPRNVAG